LIAVLTVATASSVNQQILQRNENTQAASDLADSAIQQAIAEIAKLPSWGTNRTTDQIQFNGPVEGSSVLVTFNDKLGVPYGTSNQLGSTPLAGWADARLLPEHKVPDKRIHVVAVAKCRNVTRTKEALIYVPNYALSLAATGKVHLTNSIVGSLKDPGDLDKVGSQPELLGPGDLATNCNLSDSVILESNSRVSGDLQSQGDVALKTGSSVGGEVRRFYSTTPMPAFPFDDYDPKKDDCLDFRSLASGTYPAQKMTGLVRCDGATTINGDLDLDNCLLFSVGDLKILGSLRGSGAVIVKGKTEIHGGGNLASQDNVAVLSRGDVSLLGSTGADYRFQGLIYTNGNFVANRFTVLGGFVADGGPGNGNVDLHDSKIYWNSSALQLDVFRPVQFVVQLPSAGNDPSAEEIVIENTIPPTKRNRLTFGKSPVGTTQAHLMEAESGISVSRITNPSVAATYNNGQEGNHNGRVWEWWAAALLEIRKETVDPVRGPELVYDLRYTELGHKKRFTSTDPVEVAKYIAAECHGRNDGYTKDDTTKIKNFTKLFNDWAAKNAFTSTEGTSNFSFDPNRFIKESEKIRLSAIIEY
jgi:hypothetical protein